MNLFALIAHPAEHSLSPAMHNAAFEALKIKAKLEAIDVTPEQLEAFMRDRHEFKGLAISTPHKTEIMRYLDEIDETAKQIGAVNTIYSKKGQRLGTNTDGLGFLNMLQEVEPKFGEKRITLLGAGGAARAIVWALAPRVKWLDIVNRTIPKGVELAKEFHCRFGGKWEDLHNETPDILINATSIGLDGLGEEALKLLPDDFIKPNMLVIDIVYRPGSETHLIQRAKAAGARAFDGKGMLLHQGMLQFELWTGEKAPREVMEQALSSSEMRNSSSLH